MGAYAGLAFGAASSTEDFKLNRLVLTSLPGVEERNPKELRKAMQATNPYLPAAWSSPFSPDMYEAGFLNKSGFRQLLESAKWVGRAVVNDPAIHGFPYWHALAKDTATDRILQVLDRHVDSSVVLVGGTEDQVSRKEAAYNTLDRVREHGYGKDRAAGIFLPGEGHDVGENSIRNAGTVRDALLAQHKKPEKLPPAA